jgi:hypothetical protein
MWSFQTHYDPGFGSDSNTNNYHVPSCGGKGQPVHKPDNLTAICELTE